MKNQLLLFFFYYFDGGGGGWLGTAWLDGDCYSDIVSFIMH